jgi:hypothetical protein
MNRASTFLSSNASYIVTFAGGVIFTQGFSFARFRVGQSISDTMNFHAVLLGLAGVALFACGLFIRATLERLSRLEKEIADLKGE